MDAGKGFPPATIVGIRMTPGYCLSFERKENRTRITS